MLLTTKEEFIIYKRKDPVSLICDYCNIPYTKSKREFIAGKIGSIGSNYKLWEWPITVKNFCCRTCLNKNKNSGMQKKCTECNKEIYVVSYIIKKNKNIFCSQSCSATYNNKNKVKGNRRSKLEAWIEDRLIERYPNLEIHFNRKDAINSELDFYFPTLNLAFELNGIFHYEPIYGADKLLRTQNNDDRKFQACIEKGIELCIIDSSDQKYFKPCTSQKYLNIITNLVNIKLSKLDCVEVL